MSSAGPGLAGLGGRVARLDGWRRSLLAALLGITAAAALPPAHVLPLLIVAFTGLAWLVAGSRSPWRAFVMGWWFGFGHFLAAFYWVGAALLTDPERYGALVVPAVLGLAAGLALLVAGAVLLVHLSKARGVARVVALAVAWTLAEWLRGHLFTGFPMALLGTAWAPIDAMLQLAALTGAYGLGLVSVAAAAAPACLAEPGGPGRRWAPVAVAALALAGIGLFGALRLAAAPDGEIAGVRLRLVQLSIAQDEKWSAERAPAIVEAYLAASAEAGPRPVSHVIWPETALPFRVAEEPGLRARLAGIVPADGLLLTGSVRSEAPPGLPRRYWNSLFAVDARGEIVAAYDKFHLVPFGEYVPFRGLLRMAKLTRGEVDFSRGPGPVTLALPGLPPVSPLICYEAIFPGAVVAPGPGPRPGWLLNVTNDAWFGTTSGPYQHFESARLRAVEEGLPLVRAANSGISAVVDSVGRVRARLGLNQRGVLDAALPVALARPPLYARFGDGLLFILLGLGAVFVLVVGRSAPSTNIKRE